MESKAYQSLEARNYDTIPQKKKYPTYMIFELSQDCNLNCIMCKISGSAKTTNKTDESKSIYNSSFVKELEEYIPHLIKAKFLGGEPFIIKMYVEIWELIQVLNPSCIIEVQTNATVLNPQIKNILEKGNFRIGVSLDSFNKETYLTIRKNAIYEKTLENIEIFNKYAKSKRYKLTNSVCPMQQNIYEIPEIISKCNSCDIIIYFNTVESPKECSLKALTSTELCLIIDKFVQIKLSEKNDTEKLNKQQFASLLNQIIQWKNNKLAEENFEVPEIFFNDSLEIDAENLKKMFLQHISETGTHVLSDGIKTKIEQFIDVYGKEKVFNAKTISAIIKIPAENIRFELEHCKDIHELITLFNEL